MKFRILSVVVVFLTALSVSAVAADVTGKWVAQLPGRGGETMESTFNLKVEGEKLTGTVVGPMGNENPISDGKISGDDLSFVIKVNFQGNEMKMLYKGKVSGDEMKLTMEMEGGMGGPGGGPGGGKPMEMTAKKVN